MDLSNLQQNMIVKNYKEMCILLEEEEKTGQSKISQQKNWSRYFNFERNGQKYVIKEIYDIPLPKEDLRVLGNRATYLEFGEALVLKYITKCEDKYIQENFVRLAKNFKLANHKYKELSKAEIKKIDENWDIYMINFFDQNSYQKLRQIMFGTLNNLQNRRLIDWEEVLMVSINEGDRKKPTIREALDCEKDFIRDTEKIILDQMGFKNKRDVHWNSKTKEFYGEVCSILRNKYDINYYFKEIKILFTHEFIIKGLDETLIRIEQIKTSEYEQKINELTVKGINQLAENQYLKKKNDIDEKMKELTENHFGEPNRMEIDKLERKYKYNELFLYAQKQLADYFIKI